MKLDRKTMVLLAVAAAATQVSAQASGKPATPAASGAYAAPAPAAPKVEPSQILLHVTGLTKDNQGAVKESLNGLGPQMYVCPTCKHEQTAPGKCTTCKVDLQAQKRHEFSNVALMPETSTIALTPAQHSAAKLSEIENALARNSVKVDESRLAIAGSATLVLGDGTADSATVIEKALRDAKLFDEVRARFDAPKSEIVVQVRAGATAPMRSAVVKAIEGANTKARLADVVWERQVSKT